MTVMRRVGAAQAYLAAGALAGASLVWAAVARVHPSYGMILGPVAAAALLWWWRGVFSRRRVVLWLEERVPTLRYSLAALLDAHAPSPPFRSALESMVNRARFAPVLARAGIRLVGIPLAVLIVSQVVARPLVARLASGEGSTATGSGGRNTARGGDANFAARVTPPAYSKIAPHRVDNPVSVTALVGSGIRFTGGWTGEAVMPSRPTVLRLEGESGRRIVALEPRADSAPRVVLELPGRDTVLASARGAPDVRLRAAARDDIGIAAVWFEIIVSSGTGESFNFRSAVLGRREGVGNDARTAEWETVLELDSLQLQAGDVVHMRAVARDANPAADAEAGSSDTRTLRVMRPGELDSLGIFAAPPPEVDQSQLSQRMLIILTERLVRQMRSMAGTAVAAESQSIAREQARLRRRVGEIIFTRLTGADEVDDEASEAMADTLSPGEALLRAASEATNVDPTHEHEEGGPVVGINRPLLEAFNAMWEAERRLGAVEPREALPPMRAALDAIQRARAAERLYLRGRAPRIVLDLPRIRLSGKREGLDPVSRAPRASAVAAEIAARDRFRAALHLLPTDPIAAVDTLILLRVDALARDPRAAESLALAIEDLRSGRDASASLRAAWRSMVGEPFPADGSRWSGAW